MPDLGPTALWALLALVAMEGWAALLHRRLWHGAWWPAHRSHHRAHRGRVEANDLLSLLHAPPAAGLCAAGLHWPHALWAAAALGVGAGMTLFGLMYLAFHDGVAHRRLPLGRLARLSWVAAMVRAHQVHHEQGGPPYGFFLSPWALARARRRQLRPAARRGRPPAGRRRPG